MKKKSSEETSAEVASKAAKTLNIMRKIRAQSAKAYQEMHVLHGLLNNAVDDAESVAASALTQREKH